MSFFKDLYFNEAVPFLKQKYGISNPHCVPFVEKIVVSAGLGKDGDDKRNLEGVSREIAMITGRRPCYRKSKKAIAGFSLKEGQNVGLFVTLRGDAMYQFLERLIYFALPRVHDFKGFSRKSFDAKNNFAFGIKDHLVFSELSYDTIVKNRGLNIIFNIRCADSVEKAVDLLKCFSFPIK